MGSEIRLSPTLYIIIIQKASVMQLRDYQKQGCKDLYNYLQTSTGNPVVSACVGAGKSIMIAAMVKGIVQLEPNKKIIMLTHVKELIENNFEKLMIFFPKANAGIVSASVGKKEYGRQITYAGIQTVHKQLNKIGWIDYVIIDEAHLVPTNDTTTYKKMLNALKAMNPNIRIIGFTGTPFRTGEGMITEIEGGIFDDICYEIGIDELIKKGFLVRPVCKSMETQADLSKVGTRKGDFIAGQMHKAFDDDQLTESALNEVEKYASDRKTGLFFCSGVQHAIHVRDALRFRGYTAECITGDKSITPKKERERILAEFKSGSLQYVTNDSVLTTGTDIPRLDMIAFLRGTKSPVLYVQMIGRGLRCLGMNAEESAYNGKTDCLVLDFGGNIERHGPVDKIKVETKKKGGGISVQPVKVCEQCREPNIIQARQCEVCGWEFPLNETIKHEHEAYNGAILAADVKPTRLNITGIEFTRHTKKNSQDSLRVSYMNGLRVAQKQWVCLEHQGFARRKAEKWWTDMTGTVAPKDVEEALDRQGEVMVPKAILVRKSDKFREVVGYEF